MRGAIITYELRKFLNSKVFKYYVMVVIFICYKALIETKNDMPMRTFTFIEGVVATLVSPFVIMWVLVPFSMYFMTNIFFDFELSDYIKIRSSSKVKWFLQKVVALFLHNCILVGTLLMASIIISLRVFKFSISWGVLNTASISQLDSEVIKSITNYVFPYQVYYSPGKVILLSLILLCGGLTLIGLAMGIVSLQLNNPRTGIILGCSYLLFSFKRTFFIGQKYTFVKYLAFDSFMLFENHNFDGLQGHLFTIRTTFILLPILILTVLFCGIILNRKRDISQGC